MSEPVSVEVAGPERGWCGIWGAEAKRAVRAMSVVVVDEHAPHVLEVWAP